MRTVNANLQFRNEFARESGLSKYAATDKIAERARVVAGMCDCTFMGLSKRGATFCVVIHDTPGSVLTPYRSFEWETVIDSPSAIIEWARDTRAIHTPMPDTWPTTLYEVSSAWFGG